MRLKNFIIMPNIPDQDQLALRHCLQAVEDAFVQGGIRHAVAKTPRGSFEWIATGKDGSDFVGVEVPALIDIERQIMQLGRDDVMVATERGFFSWTPKRDDE